MADLSMYLFQHAEDHVVVVLEGDLDCYTSQLVQVLLRRLFDDIIPVVEVDLRHVKYIDLSGLGVLATAHTERMDDLCGPFYLTDMRGLNLEMLHVLDRTGLIGAFKFCEPKEHPASHPVRSEFEASSWRDEITFAPRQTGMIQGG